MSDTSQDAFVLWRPSFAGSWRSIGEFPTAAEAETYAQSKPWIEHGRFDCWEVGEKRSGPPNPHWTPKFEAREYGVGSTASVQITGIFQTPPTAWPAHGD